MFDGLFELLSYYERHYEDPAYRDAAARLRDVIGQIGEGRKALRADIQEVVQRAYDEGWTTSKKWPNHPVPPRVTIDWGGPPGGIHIHEEMPPDQTRKA